MGGPELAAHALPAGLVDECHLFAAPRSSAAAATGSRTGYGSILDLIDEQLDSGFAYLGYRTVASAR